MPQAESELLLQNSLDPIQALLEGLHRRSVRKADEMVARAVKEVSSLGRIQVKEDAWHDLKDRKAMSVIGFQ